MQARVGDARDESHARARARFEAHRRAFAERPALRALYGRWYRAIARALPPRALGRFIELGSGPGLARSYVPELELSDVVAAPWLDHQIAAERLPFADRTLGALVLFDVLHHVPSPSRFFDEASRVLAPGGRVIVCEPYVSPLSYPVYRFLHEESLSFAVDPFTLDASADKDPFAGNQAVPTKMLMRAPERFAGRFPSLRIVKRERLSGPSYPASGGFGRAPLVPAPLWRALVALEDHLPEAAFGLIGFRMLVVIERV